MLWGVDMADRFLGANQISQENTNPGDIAWILTNPAGTWNDFKACDTQRRGIEGYASATSVCIGQTISFHVHCDDLSYGLKIFRLGWYGGTGARQLHQVDNLAGKSQRIPDPNLNPFYIECDWEPTYSIQIPMDWVSGIYLAKLTASKTSKQNYILFAVRDDFRPTHFLFQSSVTTFQAYNAWPLRDGGIDSFEKGKNGLGEGRNPSLYTCRQIRDTDPKVRENELNAADYVSFQRPYGLSDDWFVPVQHQRIPSTGFGAGDFLWWEVNLLRFLEREGYDVSYCTNVDVDRDPDLLLKHRCFLSVGHDEYWSLQMRRNVESARDRGVNLAFFSANTCFDCIEFNSDRHRFRKVDRAPNYKRESDILVHGEASFTDEDKLIGIRLIAGGIDGNVENFNLRNWVCENAGLTETSTLPHLLGHEVDGVHPRYSHTPKSLEFVARSRYWSYGESKDTIFHPKASASSAGDKTSDMTVYVACGSAAKVFACGTIQWSWGLDSFNSEYRATSSESGDYTNDSAKAITRNVLSRLSRRNGARWAIQLNRGDHTIRFSPHWFFNDIGLGGPGAIPFVGHFDKNDKNGRADMGLYIPDERLWMIRRNNGQGFDSDFISFFHDIGGVGELPIVGDFDGDGVADFGVYIPHEARWAIKLNRGDGAPRTSFFAEVRGFGGPDELPIVGDFDGDGKSDLGVYNARERRIKLMLNRGNGNFGPGIEWEVDHIGGEGEIAIAGNFSGGKQCDLGVYIPRRRYWAVKRNRGGGAFGPDWYFEGTYFGGEGEIPIVGDFNGDGLADIGVYIYQE